MDLTIAAGATYRITLPWDGEAPAFDDATAKMQIRTGPGGSLLAALTDGDGLTLTDEGVDVVLTAAETAALIAPRCQYDVLLQLADGDTGPGDRLRTHHGAVTVESPVTVWTEPEDDDEGTP